MCPGLSRMLRERLTWCAPVRPGFLFQLNFLFDVYEHTTHSSIHCPRRFERHSPARRNAGIDQATLPPGRGGAHSRVFNSTSDAQRSFFMTE